MKKNENNIDKLLTLEQEYRNKENHSECLDICLKIFICLRSLLSSMRIGKMIMILIFSNMFGFWKKHERARRIGEVKERRREVTDNFGVEYRNGRMYIVSGSNAIEELSDDMTVGKIRERLEQIKKDALKYKGL